MPNFGALFGNANRLMYVLIGAGVLLVILVVVLVVRGIGGGPGAGESATLEFWGVFDDTNAFDRAITQFGAANPNIEVNYRRFSYQDYERSLVNAMAAGTGPDIFMIHNTWLAKHADKIRPLDQNDKALFVDKKPLMTVKDFHDQFVDVAAQDLILNNKIYALPLYVDTLALYYNKDLFNAAGISTPPATWEQFNTVVEQLTKLDESGNITQSGAAIGSARNINRATDILASLMMQSGVRMTNPEHTQATFADTVQNQRVGEVALQYYTDFTNPIKRTYCWNDNQHYSIDAFAEGATAIMINYSHQIGTIRSKASHLNFAVAPMPQLSNAQTKVTYADFWAPAVAAKSTHALAAWNFLTFLSSRNGALTYLTDTKRPAARRDIIPLQKDDQDLGVYANQALTAQSWYQVDNIAIESIFAEMIDDVNLGRSSIKDALQNAQAKVNVIRSNTGSQ